MRAIQVRIKEKGHTGDVMELETVLREVDIKSYKDYYALIGAELFDVVQVQWNKHPISIFVDDEGMLKPNYGRMVQGYPQPLFGNFVLCGGVDVEGNTLPFPDEIDIEDLMYYMTPPMFTCGM